MGRYKTWTLDSGLDYGIKFGLNLDWTAECMNLTHIQNFPGLPSFWFMIGSSLAPKFKIPVHFTAY